MKGFNTNCQCRNKKKKHFNSKLLTRIQKSKLRLSTVWFWCFKINRSKPLWLLSKDTVVTLKSMLEQKLKQKPNQQQKKQQKQQQPQPILRHIPATDNLNEGISNFNACNNNNNNNNNNNSNNKHKREHCRLLLNCHKWQTKGNTQKKKKKNDIGTYIYRTRKPNNGCYGLRYFSTYAHKRMHPQSQATFQTNLQTFTGGDCGGAANRLLSGDDSNRYCNLYNAKNENNNNIYNTANLLTSITTRTTITVHHVFKTKNLTTFKQNYDYLMAFNGDDNDEASKCCLQTAESQIEKQNKQHYHRHQHEHHRHGHHEQKCKSTQEQQNQCWLLIPTQTPHTPTTTKSTFTRKKPQQLPFNQEHDKNTLTQRQNSTIMAKHESTSMAKGKANARLISDSWTSDKCLTTYNVRWWRWWWGWGWCFCLWSATFLAFLSKISTAASFFYRRRHHFPSPSPAAPALQTKTLSTYVGFKRSLFIILGLHLIYLCSDTQAIRLTNSLSKSSSGNKEQLYIGLIAPHTNFGKREYLRAIHTAVSGLNRTRGAKLTFFKDYQFEPKNIRFDMMSLTPSPTAILSTLCKEFLQYNVSAILYMMNNEQFGHSTASAQYFLQLAGYLGIPVISWNADNSGLERRASQSTLQLQLAPSIEHQSAAMLSILERYKWHQFSVVTSQIAGHDDFVQAVRERVAEMQEHFKFTILNAIVVTRTSDLMELVNSEARVMLLYATQTEAITILKAAEDLKLTGENYVWVVTQSVIEKKDAHPQFPVGMLGVHFDTSSAALMSEISNAIKIYGYGVEAYVSDAVNRGKKLNTQSLSCEDEGRGRWDNGESFFRYLRNVSIEGDLNKPNIEFTADGDLKSAELKIMNLRPSANNKNLVWEEIGVWKSWETQKLDIRDIAWPGNSHAPPQGVPEKFHLKITFLEEAPYINLSPADPVSGKCLMDRGVLCRVAADHLMADIDVGQAHRNESFYQCCSGFCIDLLEKFAEELGFTYELVRVEDGKWGTLENGKWNGLIADLVNRKTDMVLTSLMINTEREAVVDFSEPFMETGIAIVVAKRTGIISPTAFLEPFDTASWMLVGIVAIQAATFMIFLFEWLSPSGYDMKLYLQNTNVTPYRFSLFRTYWLVWAVLFQAAVHVDSPRGFTSRFMTNVWALFAVVFLAIYTANLAAFMITREEFHEFTGLNDSRLVHPYSHKPSFKFGTIPYSHTDSTIKKYFKEMHYYMKQHNKSTVADGVTDVLSGNLDAFIYDGTVLDYLVAQDEDCRLMIAGSWYAMTGYGLAFSRNSKYVQMFNKRLLEFRANGDLERLRRFWMTGTCRPGKQEHKSSDPLALEQFLSAFLLLMAGILLAALLLLLEHVYFKYIRIRIAKKDGGHCCALISLSMGKSLTFRGAVFEATEILKKHRCNDPICDTHLWKVKHDLDMTRLRLRQLEKTLEKHGIKPPQLRLASSSDLLNHHHLKERPPLLGNLSLAASAQDLYRWSYKTEIAEMETVL